MDKRKLYYDLIDAVAWTLHSYEKKDHLLEYDDVVNCLNGARERYRNDPVFNRKVQRLVSQITQVVEINGRP